MEPQTTINKNVKANVNLLPGSSGAEYNLPVHKTSIGDYPMYISRWKLSFKERLKVLIFGSVWLGVISQVHPAVKLSVDSIFEGEPD